MVNHHDQFQSVFTFSDFRNCCTESERWLERVKAKNGNDTQDGNGIWLLVHRLLFRNGLPRIHLIRIIPARNGKQLHPIIKMYCRIFDALQEEVKNR